MSIERNDEPLRGSTELWSLREDVHVHIEAAGGSALLISEWGNVTIRWPSPEVREALRRMPLGPISLDNVLRSLETMPHGSWGPDGDAPSLARLHDALDQLQPFIIRSLGFDSGQPLVSVVPLTPRSRFRPVRLPPDMRVRLSAFAQLRTDGSEYRIESPLSAHKVLLHQPEAMAVVGSLGRPVSVAASANSWPGRESLAADLLAYLVAAGMAVEAGDGATEHASTLGWSPADLAFHARSNRGRHDYAVGRTYPMGRKGSPEPVAKPGKAGIALHRPTWESLVDGDPSLAVVMEARRSVRAYGAEAVTEEEIGDLLYRAARVRSVIVSPSGAAGSPAAGDSSGASEPPVAADSPVAGGSPVAGEPFADAARDARLSDRPYPGGGACYELEIYIAVGDCDGIPSGVYHYDPLGHCLEPVNPDPRIADGLLRDAGKSAGLDAPPPVLITVTARIQRLSWKYEGIVYATVMKDAGVLLQNLYLICTAMRLAPCALGSVNIDITARAFGVDWRAEPSVAQFILGRAPEAPPRYEWQWDPVNDPQWAGRARAALDAKPI